MTGTVRFTFGDTPRGVALLFERVRVLRREGLRTRVTTERGVAGKFVLHTLTVTAPAHRTRRERGLLC